MLDQAENEDAALAATLAAAEGGSMEDQAAALARISNGQRAASFDGELGSIKYRETAGTVLTPSSPGYCHTLSCFARHPLTR